MRLGLTRVVGLSLTYHLKEMSIADYLMITIKLIMEDYSSNHLDRTIMNTSMNDTRDITTIRIIIIIILECQEEWKHSLP